MSFRKGSGPLPHERAGHGLGADALARDTAGGVGGAEEERRVRPVVNHSGPSPALNLPRREASVVQSVADRCSKLFAIELDLQFRHGRPDRGTAYQTISSGAAPAASYVLAARG